MLAILTILAVTNVKLFFDLSSKNSETDLETKTTKYPYLASRVVSDFERDLIINFIPLRKELKKVTTEYGQSFSVYFEYLPTGVSIGINDKIEFYGASLVKVPLAMVFLDHYQKNGLNLDEVVKISKEEINPGFGNLWRKGEGAEISLREALKLALTESDNTAAQILLSRVSKDEYIGVYENLDIEFNIDQDQVILTTKGYASILKALYFSSFLNKDDSQYILELMTSSDFMDRLRAPIPKEITIANKAGVFFNDLHQDCGIVYLPRRPYILCMASQSSEEEATQRMQKVSGLVYRYISEIEK